MATLSPTIRRMGLFALIALASSTLAIASPAENTPSLHIERQLSTQNIFDELVEANFDYWNEKNERAIALKEAEARANELSEESRIRKDLATRQAAALKQLAEVIKNDGNDEASLKARLHTALLLRSDASKRSYVKELLDAGIQGFENSTATSDTKCSVLLLAGEFAYQAKQFRDSESYYKSAVSTVASQDGSLLKTRALIGLADARFADIRYDEASAAYVLALANIAKATSTEVAAQSSLVSGVQARLVWSSYREGNYQNAARWAFEFTRSRQKIRDAQNEKVRQEILRVGGVALYELADEKLFLKISSDALAGDIGKELVISGLEVFVTSGRGGEVEAIARLVRPEFHRSRKLVLLDALRARAAEKIDSPSDRHDILSSIAVSLSNRSSWKKKFELSSGEERMRASVVALASESAAEIAFEEGTKVGSRESFASCARLYQIRINEETTLGFRRGQIALKAAQCFYKISDYAQAWEYAEESLKYPLDNEELRASYDLHVAIARDESRDFSDRKNAAFLRQEHAVDAFLGAFPSDNRARQSMFELALRLAKMDELSESRKRLERLISQLPLQGSAVENELRERALRELSSVNLKERDAALQVRAQSRVEKYTSEVKVGEATSQEVWASSAAAVRNYVHSLRVKGQLKAAADIASEWSHRFPANPEAAAIALEGIRAYGELMAWSEVETRSRHFLEVFKSHPLRFEVMYWQGRSHEAQLAFLPAAEAFEDAAFVDESKLRVDERVEALGRAQKIYLELGNKTKSATLLRKVAQLESRQNASRGEVHAARLAAAKQFSEVGRVEEARDLLRSVVSDTKAEMSLRLESQLELDLIGMRFPATRSGARVALEKMCVRLSELMKSGKTPFVYAALFERAYVAASDADTKDFAVLSIEDVSRERMQTVSLKRALVKRADARARLLDSTYISKTLRRSGYKALSAMHQEMHRDLAKVAHIALDESPGLVDAFSREADVHSSQARSAAFLALENAEPSSVERLQLSRELSALQDVNVQPEPSLEVSAPEQEFKETSLKRALAEPEETVQ